MSKGEGCLTTAGFYGAKNKRKWIGLENSINGAVKRHQSEKIPKSFPSRILGPTTTWQTFYRQQEAFQYCKSTSKDLHVFAFESGCFEGNTGQRLYLTASYPVFWHYYSQLDEQKKVHYEVIPEGAVCKLYFDLEYDRGMNPDHDGNAMVDIFIQCICRALKLVFNLTCTRQDVLDLGASTEKKFSRHLIFQMKNAAFKDNIHAGRFVCRIMSRLLENIHSSDTTGTKSNPSLVTGTDKVVDSGLINKKSSPNFVTATDKLIDSEHINTKSSPNLVTATDKLIIDSEHINTMDREISEGVFNENDKIPMNVDKSNGKPLNDSGKSHASAEHENDNITRKEEIIETVKENKESKDENRRGKQSDKFKEIFASFADEDLEKLIVTNKNGDKVLFCDTGVYTKNRNFRLFLSSKLGKMNPLVVTDQNKFRSQGVSEESKLENIFYDSLVANVQYSSSTRILSFDEGNLSTNLTGLPNRRKDKSSQESECIDGYNKSPYPEVDDYIRNIISGDSGKGVIRHWTYFHQGELLVYEITKYRFCHNIGRHHRSNNIMIIADLQKGVWYQKCHDPECHAQNYKSPEWPLPRDILPVSYFDDDFDLDMDDDELLNATVELEKQYMEQQAQSSGNLELDDGADAYLLAAVSGQI